MLKVLFTYRIDRVMEIERMKTFETEKHNIPEGATHYFNETSEEHFAWWDDNKQMLLDPENANEWVNPNEFDDVSNPVEIPKPRTKTEFVKCEFVSDKEKAEAFIEGGLRYFTRGAITGDKEKDTIPVTRLDELLCGASIYRKVETEIDERQEFIDEVERISERIANEGSDWSFACIATEMFDSGKFKLVEK